MKLVALRTQYIPSFEFGVGYLPKPKYDAMRYTVAINNFLFKQKAGVYVTYDKGHYTEGPWANYWAVLTGCSYSISRVVTVYGGMDFITLNHGMRGQGIFCRKELGVDLYPWRGLAIRLGYSFMVTFHCGIGWKFDSPFSKEAPRRRIYDIDKYRGRF